MTGLGLFSKRIKKDVLKQKNEVDYIVGLKKSLERRGFSAEDIINVAKEVGFSRKNIDKVRIYFDIINKQKKNKRKAY